MEKQTVASVKRSENEEIRILMGTYKERDYVDIRLFYKDPSGDWKPTKKGITIRRDFFGSLLEGLKKCEEILSETQTS